MSGYRLNSPGRIDRLAPLSFRFDGMDYSGYGGDTLASALLAVGVDRVSTSLTHGRPRGVFAAGREEPNALVQVEAPFPEPMLTATTVELYDGLVASSLRGRGRLAELPDPDRYDTVHAHCDVLVVGAGPAGLAAADVAARSGARVILADDETEPGGSLLGTGALADWVGDVTGQLAAEPETRVLARTAVIGYYDDNYLIAVQRLTDQLGPAAPEGATRQRVWRIRAAQVVLATGATERSVAFADNDRPGVMLASAARTYVNRYAVAPGRRAVVYTTNDSTGPVVDDLARAGVDIVATVDARRDEAVVEVIGAERVTGVRTAAGATLDADLLLVSGGWNPVVHLWSHATGTLRYDASIGAFVPDRCRQAVGIVGAAAGEFTTAGALRTGAEAGQRVAAAAEFPVAPARPLPTVDEPRTSAPPAIRWLIPSPDGRLDRHFVDLQRDITAAEIVRATGAGLRDVELVKRYTTAGTAHDQGKTSGILVTGVVADTLGIDVGELGTTTFRPPYVPVTFAALAGRERGHRYDPVRVTSSHDRQAALGARFEDVGQWKRAWFYPRGEEDMGAAVLRECRAARTDAAFMDASTLGKIDVQGPDAAELLDRLYTNLISSLKVGSIRYGVMCTPDGMVFDDGTVSRVGERHFVVTTTTGNAAAVLDWMEEWLQTEWPDLAAYCTSVTEQWATIALAGPRSREVLRGLAPDLAVANDDFPFMTWRDTAVAGLGARVARISFSGELAYEITVPWSDGQSLWDAVADTGATPYGTETMHVLRAEKGYPIVGQDTDGTVTPQDLGLSWVVSKKKPDFVGKRSHARADNRRPDRKHLVGLLPEDRSYRLVEGAQLVETDPLPAPPVPMLGHVTSSYVSAALDRTFGLALLSGGRERIGQTLYAAAGDDLVPVTVTGPVLVDPEGARRDG